MGQRAYKAGPLQIERRFKSGYLGGGRRLSAQIWYVFRDGVAVTRPLPTLRDAKAAAEALA